MILTCSFSTKQTIPTSSPILFEIHVYYSVLLHIFIVVMLSGVCIYQETKFCSVVPEYGLCFLLHFLQEDFEISSNFLENFYTVYLNKGYHSPLSATLPPAAPSGQTCLVLLFFLHKVVNFTFIICMIALCHCTSSSV